MRTLCAGSLLLLLLTFAAPASAQTCEQNETIAQCANKFIPPVAGDDRSEESAEADTKTTEDATAGAATGLTNIASVSESPLKDFLTLFAASMETATTTQEGQAFTFDWNPELAFAKNLGAKLQASFPETKLNDEVTKSLAGNTAKLESLQDSLEFGDDTLLSGFLEPESETHGRNIENQRPWFRLMRNAVLEPRMLEDEDFLALLDKHKDIGSHLQRFENNADGTKPTADEIKSRIDDFTALFQQRKEARAGRTAFFMAFAKLLNNQPQFYGAVTYHARRNVIGPNAWSAKATYEHAGNNLNAFRKSHSECSHATLGGMKDKNEQKAASEDCVEKLKTFADATQAGMERISVSLEYHKVNRRWINDPDAGLDLGFPGTRSFVGSVAFGTVVTPVLPLRAQMNGVGDARLDFTAKYELPEDDQSESKGFVGSLTYTQKISETFSLPIALVYSDHASDLTNVQKRFSSRFGLMYKLPDFK